MESPTNNRGVKSGFPLGRRGAFILVLVFLGGVLSLLGPLGRYLAASRGVAVPVAPGPLYPFRDDGARSSLRTTSPSSRGKAALEADAQKPLSCVEHGRRVLHARVALSKLFMGRDVEEVNRSLCAMKPWGSSGTTWALNPFGDYDFAEIDFVALLYTFRGQPGKLYPETARHVVDTLLIENGNTPDPKAPRTFGAVMDTENHVLMRESTRYLKNQWCFEQGTPEERGNPAFDNERNGLGVWMLEHLAQIRTAGFYEFNSIPYLSFTMRALLNLDAFASNREVALGARHLIDVMNWQYALGSLDLRRCVPFRRQAYRAAYTGLQQDMHTPFMMLWTNAPAEPSINIREEVIAEVLPYRLPKAVQEWALEKPRSYFVKFGHGPGACPEIFSGGPNYLISAGGAGRGWKSMVAARPTSLLLRDGAKDLDGCFYLTGRGGFTAWNNTGVCGRFACVNGGAHIPEHARKAFSNDAWTLYSTPSPGLTVAVHEAPGVALLALFADSMEPPESLAGNLAKANPNPAELARAFHWPDGKEVAYDLNAPRDKWVITAIYGKAVDRDYDQWPQMDGDAPQIRLERN